MPTYCFCTDDGEQQEHTMSVADLDAIRQQDGTFLLDNGKKARIDFSKQCAGRCHVSGEAWPKLSDAMAVHPSQVASETERLRKMGCPTEFMPDGRPVERSASHHKKLAKTLGMVDYQSWI